MLVMQQERKQVKVSMLRLLPNVTMVMRIILEGKTVKKKAVAKVTVRKPKAAPKKKAATVKKVEKAVKTAKKTQPAKPTSKKGLLGRVGDAVKKGVERHIKARAAGKVPEKRVKESAKGFKKGVTGTVKFAGKVKKAVSEETVEVDEGIGDMAIEAIEKPTPYISKRSSMIRDIKLKQLKSYLKKQDDKKKKAASKD